MSVSKTIHKTKTHENKLVLICEPMSVTVDEVDVGLWRR